MTEPDPTDASRTPEQVRPDEILRADPQGARPSAIAGMSQAELEEIQANIRWFSALTLDEELSVSRRARAWARQVLQRTASVETDRREDAG